MTKKPSVTSPCGAERHNQQKHTRIIEFHSGDSERGGGLIEFRNLDATGDEPAKLLVIPYSMDDGVKVNVRPNHLHLSDHDWRHVEAIIAERETSTLNTIRSLVERWVRDGEPGDGNQLAHASMEAMQALFAGLKK